MNQLAARTFVLCILLAVSKFSYGRDSADTAFKRLITKEWKLASYEKKGKNFPPAPQHKEDKMIFYQNNEVKSTDGGKVEYGIWKYDADKKTLTVIDNDSLEETVLKVVKLDEAGCILEYQDPQGGI